jgi:hypothetical protein
MRKHDEDNYGFDYQRYKKDHLCKKGKVVKGGKKINIYFFGAYN